jgi:hypothetical protein
MGNSQTKEARLPPSPSRTRVNAHSPGTPKPEPTRESNVPEPTHIPVFTPRNRRGSRPDLSFLGIGGNSDQDASSLEARRESKQEREARKVEKERVARIKERERSMKEEHVDGGYLVTQGVYVGIEDFNKSEVRQLMIERMLAPFWKGLNDFSESWAEHQLMAAARGLPIPPADQVPPELEYRMSPKTAGEGRRTPDGGLNFLTVPIGSRSQSFNSEASSNPSPSNPTFSLPPPSSPLSSNSANSPLFRTRAKTLASLTTGSKNNLQSDMTRRELQLPKDPFVNGQPIEVYLYKDASECPICFLYYPPYLNTTRCCDQAICSECFVQIKRPDPHPPEHEQPDPNAPPLSTTEREAQSDGQLVSEVATCPFCKQPEFGITYVPPPFRRGVTYSTGPQPYQVKSAMSSQTSVLSGSSGNGRRRGTSISANAPEVVTTDKIRPDWASKLATARAHAARRSAAATALHTAAYLMNGTADTRPFGPFGRRGLLRRPTLEGMDNVSSSAHLNALALLAERHSARQQEMENGGSDVQSNPFLPPPRGSSTRRTRMEDLEDMMMMEAIRLSLASEEDRRKKEEKEAKKEAKKKEKETKKAEKAAKKSGMYTMNSNTAYGDAEDNAPMARTESVASSIASDDGAFSAKGKGVDRTGSSPIAINDHSRATGSNSLHAHSPSGTSQESLPTQFPSLPPEPVRRSHLRHMSTASSSTSSFVESGSPTVFAGTNTPPGVNPMEPMFNFRSLAAMIGDEEKGEGASHVEHHDPSGKMNVLEAEDENAAGGSLLPLTEVSGNRHEGGNHDVQYGEEMRGSQTSPLRANRDATDS